MPNGDGLWLRGRTLYVVQNRLERGRQDRAEQVRHPWPGGLPHRQTTSFDVPTTIAEYGDRLYLPNARFTTPADADHALQRGLHPDPAEP